MATVQGLPGWHLARYPLLGTTPERPRYPKKIKNLTTYPAAAKFPSNAPRVTVPIAAPTRGNNRPKATPNRMACVVHI